MEIIQRRKNQIQERREEGEGEEKIQEKEEIVILN